MAQQSDYLIPRNAKAIIVRVVGLYLVADLLFGFIAFLIVLVRETLSIDTTFSLLIWLIFFVKMGFTAFAAYQALKKWHEFQYYVINGNLIIQNSGSKHDNQEIFELKFVKSTKVNQHGLAKNLNSGDITLVMSDVEVRKDDEIVLRDVDDPRNIAKLLKSYKRQSITKK